MIHRPSILRLAAALALLGGASGPAPAEPVPPAHLTVPAPSVLDLQPELRPATVALPDGTRLTLIDLNPTAGEWFVLLRAAPGQRAAAVHLENPLGTAQRLDVETGGLAVTLEEERVTCPLQTDDGRDLFARQTQPFATLCGGRLLLRSQQAGYRTTEELATSLLRRMGAIGEAIINLYKETAGADAGLERARTAAPGQDAAPAAPGGPVPARLAPTAADTAFAGHRLGIGLAGGTTRPVAGRWHATQAQPGAFVSLIAPRQIDRAILERDLDRANPLDGIEANALVYLLAFDLDLYAVNFHVGTDHPAVDWSPRPAVARPNPRGPDAIANVLPLARVGMVPPQERPRLAGIFVGGFKREHGAFRYGPLSLANLGTHYGFVERGVVLSRLQPGLSTLFGRIDGSVGMRTWTAADDAGLPRLAFARQNGVALVETDAAGRPVPGREVTSWGLGNWSGALVIRTDPEGHQTRSAELRSVRAGACLQEQDGWRFLIYAYFSAATPSAMARVFQAYGCRHAMLLDMNSADLTYAVLVGHEGGLTVEHLDRAMAGSEPGRGLYRFLNANDNRDFFTVIRRAPR